MGDDIRLTAASCDSKPQDQDFWNEIKNTFEDTALHAAVSSEDFLSAIEIMALKPSVSRTLNKHGFTPFHLVFQPKQSAPNQEAPLEPTQPGQDPDFQARLRHNLVLCFLEFDENLARVKGKGGLTPFHYAAKTGDLELLIEILSVCPKSIVDTTIKNKTVLHIALENNKFDAFILLEDWLLRDSFKGAYFWEQKLRICKDEEGNTFSDTAAKLLDMSQVSSFKIGRVLRRVDALYPVGHMTDGARTAVLAIAGLLVTVTFQTVLNLPGGIWRDDYNCNTSPSSNCAIQPSHRIGTAVMSPGLFRAIIICCYTSFLYAYVAVISLLRRMPINIFPSFPIFLLGVYLLISTKITDPVRHTGITPESVVFSILILATTIWALFFKGDGARLWLRHKFFRSIRLRFTPILGPLVCWIKPFMHYICPEDVEWLSQCGLLSQDKQPSHAAVNQTEEAPPIPVNPDSRQFPGNSFTGPSHVMDCGHQNEEVSPATSKRHRTSTDPATLKEVPLTSYDVRTRN